MASIRSDQEQPTREDARYRFAVPMVIELSNGLFRQADRLDASLVDLSAGGAALIAPQDPRLKRGKRYRVAVDDHEGICEIRNISPMDSGQVRLGVLFSRLGLELQELVADSIANAKIESSRIAPSSS